MMDNGSNFSLNVYPSVESIEEVQVLTSNYGAQYGRNGSGTVEVETKSGTNKFHGSVWEFARNEAFNAHNYFDIPGTPKAGYHKHDFGYSVGGPIWKNRTFFFWLQNWRREVVPYNFDNIVPSDGEPAGEFQRPVCADRPNPNRLPHRSKHGKSISKQPTSVHRSKCPTSAAHDPRGQHRVGCAVGVCGGRPGADALARRSGPHRPRLQFQVARHVPRDSRFLGHHKCDSYMGQRKFPDDWHAFYRARRGNGGKADRNSLSHPA